MANSNMRLALCLAIIVKFGLEIADSSLMWLAVMDTVGPCRMKFSTRAPNPRFGVVPCHKFQCFTSSGSK